MRLQLSILLSFLVAIAIAQAPGDLPRDAEPGKCYAKCLVDDAYEEYEIEVPVYTGDPDDKTVKRMKKTFVIVEESTKWVKKKDENCLSRDANDCLVWELITIPGIVEERIVVKKPSKTDQYIWETIVLRDYSLNEGYIEWKEVLCADKVTAYLISEIQEKLIARGFLVDFPKEDRIDSSTKEALQAFQKENNLPVGNLDFETLDALGVNY